MGTIKSPLSQEIKRLRLEKNISQSSLAKACGVSQPFIARLELGEKSFRTASPFGLLISQALGVPISHWTPLTSDGDLVEKLADDAVLFPIRGLANGDPRIGGDLEVLGIREVLNLRARFPENCFVLRVAGWSFLGFGILNDDHIAVAPSAVPEEGRLIVVGRGAGLTLKGYRDGKFWEWPPDHGMDVENRATEVSHDEAELVVMGNVIQVIGDRRFASNSPYNPAPY